MTSLERLLKKNNVSFYKVAQLMTTKENAKSFYTLNNEIKKKVQGKMSISMEELLKLLKVVSTDIGTPITLDQIKYDPIRVIIK